MDFVLNIEADFVHETFDIGLEIFSFWSILIIIYSLERRGSFRSLCLSYYYELIKASASSVSVYLFRGYFLRFTGWVGTFLVL